jgi:hypothetical protein
VPVQVLLNILRGSLSPIMQEKLGAMHGSTVPRVLVLRPDVALRVAAFDAVIAVRALKVLFLLARLRALIILEGAANSGVLLATLARAR